MSKSYQSIIARINGEWDNPLLEEIGPLFIDEKKDFERIIDHFNDLTDDENDELTRITL